MISLDRSKSESAIDRSSLMKKSRSRSIFGVFLSSSKAPVVDEQGDILNEISRDSFAWDSGEGVEGGQWKKKLAQDEVRYSLLERSNVLSVLNAYVLTTSSSPTTFRPSES